MTANRALLATLVVVLSVAAGAGLWLLGAERQPSISSAPEPMTGAPAASPPGGGFVAVEPAADFARLAPLDATGQPADLSAYRGKALLVNFWATWCAPCIKELPTLAKLQEVLGGPDFAVLTVALDEPAPAKIAAFLAEHGAAGLPALYDGSRSVDKVMPISALPTSLLVDKAGKVRASLTGDATWDCGKALEAVKAFAADGTIRGEELEPCS